MDTISIGKYISLGESGIFTYDLVLDRMWGDRQAASIMGFDEADLNDGIRLQAYLDRVHPEDLVEFAEKKHASILHASTFQNSHRLVRKNAEPTWVTVHSRPCRVQDGLPTLISGVISTGRRGPAD
ncbi:PAS domain-containing protein [Pseudomonas sp. R2.Fl]|nr:PAS domain-containing protein [Pseudomonas sp. R2.Fl]